MHRKLSSATRRCLRATRGPLAALVVAFLVALDPAIAQTREFAFIEPAVEQIMQEWQAPGAIVVVVAEGTGAFAQGFGLADVATGEPVDVDRTVFRLASLSKPITASAAMRLAQQERLDLDAPIDRYLPTITGEARFDGVTAAHLMTHTAGFTDRFLTRKSRDLTVPPLADYLSGQMPARPYPPGEVSLYSNHGMALLGLAVAKVHGAPFEETMQALVFRPLGMGSATFTPTADALAQGYRWGQPIEPGGIRTVPSSMLAATGTDMAKWMLALTAPLQSDYLSADTVASMLARQFEHHPDLVGRSYGFSEDSTVVPRRLFHSGALEGFSSGLAIVPDQAVGVLIAFNGRAYVWDLMRSILDVVAPATPRQRSSSARDLSEIDWSGAAGLYAPADLPRHSFDRVRILFEQSALQVNDAGIIHNANPFQHDEGLAFRDRDDRLAVLSIGSEDRWFLISSGDVLRRIGALESWPIHLVALIVFVSWFGYTIYRPLPADAADPASQRLLRTGASLNLLFIVGLGATMAVTMTQGGGALHYVIPWYLWVLLSLPLVTLAATGMGVGRALMIGRATGWMLGTLTLTIIFAAWLGYWRLLGYHF